MNLCCCSAVYRLCACGIVGALGLASTALAVKPCTPNGIVEKGEGCDPSGPVFRSGDSCQTEGFDGGTLLCTATCRVDTSDYFVTPDVVFPGDGVTGPALSYTDNNTPLVWEKKDNVAGVHNVGNTYQWSGSGGAADGSLFTTFLATLNTDPCLRGHCDWRIPTLLVRG